MRVLLTGAAGFIGSTIADLLLARGDEVVALDVLLPLAHGGSAPVWAPANLQIADVRDPRALTRALRGVDVVCHQAAMVGLGVDLDDLPGYLSHNAVGTATLLSAMVRAGVSRLVQASSVVVHGEGGYDCPVDGPVHPGPRTSARLAAGEFEPPCPVCGGSLDWRVIDETAALNPRNAYAVSKLTQEQLADIWARQSGGSATSLRYHNVYGPRMPRNTPYAGVAAIFRSALEAGRPPRVYEDGDQQRDFVHVADVAAANVAALDRAVTLHPGPDGDRLSCIISSGTPHTVGDFARELATSSSGAAPVIAGGGRPGDVRHVVASPELARRVLGWTAQIGFVEGVAAFATDPMRDPTDLPPA